MTITEHPLHRSQRAQLTHWAPPLGDDGEALLGIGVVDAWRWARSASPTARSGVAASRTVGVSDCGDADCATTTRRHLDGRSTRQGRCGARRNSGNAPERRCAGRLQPRGRGHAGARRSSVFTSLQLALHALFLRLPKHDELSLPRLVAAVREAEKVEGLGLPLTRGAVGSRPRIARTRSVASCQDAVPGRTSRIARAARPGTARHPTCTGTHHDVVGEAHDDDIAAGAVASATLSPQVEGVVQIDVRQQRANARPLRTPSSTLPPLPSSSTPALQPLLDVAPDALVPDPVLDEPHQPVVVDGVERNHECLHRAPSSPFASESQRRAHPAPCAGCAPGRNP